MERVDLDVATEFLLIAATLVELKARRLLPGRDDIDLDEELMRFEERDLLLARLLECKTFQDAAQVLQRAPAEREPLGRPHRRARRSRSARSRPIRSSGSSLDAFLAAARVGAVPEAAARSSHRPHRADPRERARRGRDGARAAARPRGAVQLPRPHATA